MTKFYIELRLLVILIFLVTGLFSFFEEVNDYVRLGAFILIFGLYDPILTSSLGGTVGHMIIGLKVKRENDEKKIFCFHWL